MSELGATLEIETTDAGLRVAGELDAHTAPELEAALAPLVDVGGTVELDLNGVTFMDSSGLRVVLAGTERVRRADGDLVIARPSPTVRRLLTISGLEGHLTIIPST